MEKFILIAFLLFIPFLYVNAQSSQKAEIIQNESLSPYFFVQEEGNVESFPLLETKVEVDIAGMTADITLKQVYKNEGEKTIEAIYVFPLGTKSAIHAMKMQIENRITEAEIHKTEEAQQIYDKAKNEGKVASLLEQKRPNVFQMKVANIMPKDRVEVTVKYTETLVPEDNIYSFIFPTVVGPRFTGEEDKETLKGKDSWTQTPYLHEGTKAPYGLDITVRLNSGIPVAKVWSDSHKIVSSKSEKGISEVKLDPSEKNGGNRDFILKYSLSGNTIQTGILLYPGKEEKFFLLMMEPPEKVDISMIPPREYLFIVDVSGSMYGFPLDISKKVMNKILDNLRGEDFFNILFFSGGSDVLFPQASPATKENIKLANEMLSKQQGGGGTEILGAFNTALKLPKKEGLSRIVVTLTDGYVSVEKEAFDLIREKMGECNFFTFGIGTSVNRYLIEGMARVGKGEPFVVTNPDKAGEFAEKFVNYIKSPLLADIKVSFEGFDAYDVEPEKVPDLFAKRPIVIFGKYKKPKGKVIITGKSGGTLFKKEIDVIPNMESDKNTAIMYLWARERIAQLADYSKLVGTEAKDEITNLGLKYTLMTDYTSFVAVDKVVRETGEVVTVKQPLPLPEGVSDYAVGEVKAMGYRAQKLQAVPMPTLMPASPPPTELKERKDFGSPEGLKKQTGIIEEEADKLPEREKEKSIKIYLSDFKSDTTITADEAEKIIFTTLKEKIENLFIQNEISKIVVDIDISEGKVEKVKVLECVGTKCINEEIEKLFSELKFKDVKGKITVTLSKK